MIFFKKPKIIIRCKESDLLSTTAKGNFLYKKLEKNVNSYYFNNCFANAVISLPNCNRNESKGVSFEIEKLLLDFCDSCAKIVNKPSMIILNFTTSQRSIKEKLGEVYEHISNFEDINLLNKKPSFYMSSEEDKYDDIIRKIIETRSNDLQKNDLFIFLDESNENLVKDIEVYLTLARSRRIYFIIVANDEKFDKYCKVKYVCNKDKIEKVLVNYNQKDCKELNM